MDDLSLAEDLVGRIAELEGKVATLESSVSPTDHVARTRSPEADQNDFGGLMVTAADFSRLAGFHATERSGDDDGALAWVDYELIGRISMFAQGPQLYEGTLRLAAAPNVSGADDIDFRCDGVPIELRAQPLSPSHDFTLSLDHIAWVEFSLNSRAPYLPVESGSVDRRILGVPFISLVLVATATSSLVVEESLPA